MVSLRVFPHMQIINHSTDWKHVATITISSVENCTLHKEFLTLSQLILFDQVKQNKVEKSSS